jgi:hypothetical protein
MERACLDRRGAPFGQAMAPVFEPLDTPAEAIDDEVDRLVDRGGGNVGSRHLAIDIEHRLDFRGTGATGPALDDESHLRHAHRLSTQSNEPNDLVARVIALRIGYRPA